MRVYIKRMEDNNGASQAGILHHTATFTKKTFINIFAHLFEYSDLQQHNHKKYTTESDFYEATGCTLNLFKRTLGNTPEIPIFGIDMHMTPNQIKEHRKRNNRTEIFTTSKQFCRLNKCATLYLSSDVFIGKGVFTDTDNKKNCEIVYENIKDDTKFLHLLYCLITDIWLLLELKLSIQKIVFISNKEFRYISAAWINSERAVNERQIEQKQKAIKEKQRLKRKYKNNNETGINETNHDNIKPCLSPTGVPSNSETVDITHPKSKIDMTDDNLNKNSDLDTDYDTASLESPQPFDE